MGGQYLNMPGTVTIKSSSALASQTSSGQPVGIRIFDAAYGTTTAASASNRFHPLLIDGTTLSASAGTSMPIFILNNTEIFVHSSVGYRFPYGVWVECLGAATSCTINYVREIT